MLAVVRAPDLARRFTEESPVGIQCSVVLRGKQRFVGGFSAARVVVDQDGEAGAPRLEVGVGRHDREAFAMIHGRLPTAEALAAVVDAVLAQRRPDAPPHPLNRLAAERWLRCRVMARPEVVGARSLAPIDPPRPRASSPS